MNYVMNCIISLTMTQIMKSCRGSRLMRARSLLMISIMSQVMRQHVSHDQLPPNRCTQPEEHGLPATGVDPPASSLMSSSSSSRPGIYYTFVTFKALHIKYLGWLTRAAVPRPSRVISRNHVINTTVLSVQVSATPVVAAVDTASAPV